jgi:peptidoglycan/LPS O-acetylase OafA/YrhL
MKLGVSSARNEAGQRYQPHIDGLRALAIIPVLFFHAGLGGFSGGYVGVDVFFVISGYLITGIILAEKDRGEFSLARFYVRRSRRILPALFATLVGSFAIAWFLLLPDEMVAFGKSMMSVATFSSNIYFWRTINYFGPGPESLPLLHTWSLAVEEQFYIAFPIVLLVVAALGRSWRERILTGAFVVSLALAVWVTPRSPAASFYVLPTRAWELLLGTMVVFADPRIPPASRLVREVVTAASLLMIVLPVFLYTPQTVFPGAAAIWPCAGAAGLILLGGGKSTAGWLLRTRVIVAVGVLSYSLYLWHWPILAFVRVYLGDQLTPLVGVACLVFVVGMAAASYFIIEQPIRRSAASKRRVLSAAAASSIAFAALGGAAVATDGFPSRFPHFVAKDRHLDELYSVGRCGLNAGQTFSDWDAVACTTNAGAGRRVVLWGDSFAGHLAPGLRRVAHQDGWEFVHYAKDYCPPLLGPTPVQDKSCRSFNDGIEKLAPAGSTVIMSGRWSSYERENVLDMARLEQTVAHLQKRGVRVILIGASPSFGFGSLDDYLYRSGKRDAPVTFDQSLNQRLEKDIPSAEFVDPMLVLCPTYRCALIDNGGELYVDSGHLSAHGSDLVAAALRKRLAH